MCARCSGHCCRATSPGAQVALGRAARGARSRPDSPSGRAPGPGGGRQFRGSLVVARTPDVGCPGLGGRPLPLPRLALLPPFPPGRGSRNPPGRGEQRPSVLVAEAAAAPRPWCFGPSVCPPLRPAMAARAPAPRILLLLLLLPLPPRGGEPLGVGEFVLARDGVSRGRAVPGPAPSLDRAQAAPSPQCPRPPTPYKPRQLANLQD